MNTAGPVSAAGAAARAFPPDALPRLIPPDGPLPLAEHLRRYGPVPFPEGGGAGDGRAGDGRVGGAASPAPLIPQVEPAAPPGPRRASLPARREMRPVAE